MTKTRSPSAVPSAAATARQLKFEHRALAFLRERMRVSIDMSQNSGYYGDTDITAKVEIHISGYPDPIHTCEDTSFVSAQSHICSCDCEK